MSKIFEGFARVSRPRVDRPERDVYYARLLKGVLIVVILLMVLYLFIRKVNDFHIILPDLIILGITFTLGLAYILLLKGKFYASASITILVTFSGMTYIGMTSMGIRDAAVLTYILAIIFTALLLGKLAALVVTILSILSVWIMIVLENRGLIVYDPWNIELIARDVSFVILFTFILMLFYESIMNKYIRELSESRAGYKEVNEKLSKQNSEIKHINQELKRAMEKAEESDRLKTAFLANLSHEIRTPMNGIIGFSELVISSDISEKERKEYNSIIANSCKQLLGVVNDIIDISKIESGVLELHKQEVNLNELMREVYEHHALNARQKSLKLEFIPGLEDTFASISTDDIKLKQIFNNLVGNAIKFTREGFVKFGYILKGKELEFFVIDSGLGIAKEKQKEIFERFIQVNSGHARMYGGTGLGLSIARAYIEKMGGKIWFHSEENSGTQFYFTLPMTKDSTSSVKKNDQKEAIVDYSARALIVEDIEYNEILLKGMLKKFSLELIFARNGQEALDLFQQNKDLDLIFMDIKLPDSDGLDITREIRKRDQKIPIIAQTAYAFAEDREKALQAGCNEVLTKPINQKALDKILSGFLK